MLAERILEGESVTLLARIFGISRSRCAQILHSYCSRIDKEAYEGINGVNSTPPTLSQLRMYREAFIYDHDDEILALDNTPIRRLRVFSSKLTNALESANIRTIEDLLNTDASSLRAIPMIGKTSIKAIADLKSSIESETNEGSRAVRQLTIPYSERAKGARR